MKISRRMREKRRLLRSRTARRVSNRSAKTLQPGDVTTGLIQMTGHGFIRLSYALWTHPYAPELIRMPEYPMEESGFLCPATFNWTEPADNQGKTLNRPETTMKDRKWSKSRESASEATSWSQMTHEKRRKAIWKKKINSRWPSADRSVETADIHSENTVSYQSRETIW